ncbi:MAG TPA: hypothetical protein VFY84_14150 [Jiangellales bacterium]|nr:hypothetical protein [Jiangellales bacterium]
MKIELVRKTALSNETNCPALYRAVDGTQRYVIVGELVDDPETLALCTAGVKPSERAVLIPPDVLDRDLMRAWDQVTN